MFRAQGYPAELGVDVAHMAISLANSRIYFRSLSDTSEKFQLYVNPYGFIPAFDLAQDQIGILDHASYTNFTALMKTHIHWSNSRVVPGWNNYSNAEKVEFFGSWFRLTLTELSFHLLADRYGGMWYSLNG